MNDWTEDFHSILLGISSAMNDPGVDANFLDEAGVALEPSLFPLLSRIGAIESVGTVELAALVGRDHSTVSRQVGRLVAAGLVARVPTADKRLRLLTPTIEGAAMLQKLAQARRERMAHHFRDWDEAERDRFIAMLRRAMGDIGMLFPKERKVTPKF